MNSSRLPGKVLMDLSGKSVLEHIVLRLSHSKLLDGIIIATSVEETDDPIDIFCKENSIECFRGSLSNVLARFYFTAKKYDVDNIVRITADCPLIDPEIVDKVIRGFVDGDYDCYGLSGEFPDGLDCTAFSFNAIKEAWKKAKLDSEKEHVGPYIENNPAIFKNGELHLFEGLGSKRWTLDHEQDYLLISNIYEALYKENDEIFLTQDILNYLEKNPEVESLNNNIIRNEGYLKSLIKDKRKEDQPIKL
jgi:spore coat polysaccharide biosynthesis protein SpsF (cytidylyltransferase family)